MLSFHDILYSFINLTLVCFDFILLVIIFQGFLVNILVILLLIGVGIFYTIF